MACVCGSASSLFGSLEPLTHTETELSVWGGVGNAAHVRDHTPQTIHDTVHTSLLNSLASPVRVAISNYWILSVLLTV